MSNLSVPELQVVVEADAFLPLPLSQTVPTWLYLRLGSALSHETLSPSNNIEPCIADRQEEPKHKIRPN